MTAAPPKLQSPTAACAQHTTSLLPPAHSLLPPALFVPGCQARERRAVTQTHAPHHTGCWLLAPCSDRGETQAEWGQEPPATMCLGLCELCCCCCGPRSLHHTARYWQQSSCTSSHYQGDSCTGTPTTAVRGRAVTRHVRNKASLLMPKRHSNPATHLTISPPTGNM